MDLVTVCRADIELFIDRMIGVQFLRARDKLHCERIQRLHYHVILVATIADANFNATREHEQAVHGLCINMTYRKSEVSGREIWKIYLRSISLIVKANVQV